MSAQETCTELRRNWWPEQGQVQSLFSQWISPLLLHPKPQGRLKVTTFLELLENSRSRAPGSFPCSPVRSRAVGRESHCATLWPLGSCPSGRASGQKIASSPTVLHPVSSRFDCVSSELLSPPGIVGLQRAAGPQPHGLRPRGKGQSGCCSALLLPLRCDYISITTLSRPLSH